MQMYECLQFHENIFENTCQAPGEQHCLLALLLHDSPSRLWLNADWHLLQFNDCA